MHNARRSETTPLPRSAPRAAGTRKRTAATAGAAAHPADARTEQAQRLALVDHIRERLAPGTLRIGEDHARVLLTLRAMPRHAADVQTVYKALLDQGHEMPMSRLYRILKTLDGGGLVQRHWEPNQGRPRSIYGVVGTDAAGQPGAAPVCAHCGAPLALGT